MCSLSKVEKGTVVVPSEKNTSCIAVVAVVGSIGAPQVSVAGTGVVVAVAVDAAAVLRCCSIVLLVRGS